MTEYGLGLGGQIRHAFSAPRTGPHQKQPTNQMGLGDRQRLGDESAQRKTQNIGLDEAKRFYERRCVGRHFLD
jgi:hypothetical protein